MPRLRRRSVLVSRNVICALCLCVLLIPLPVAANSEPPLIETISELRSKGYRILYSSDLVQPDQTLAIEEVSIKALRNALPLLSLELKRYRDGYG